MLKQIFFLSLILFACESDKGVAVHNATPQATIISHVDDEVVIEGELLSFEATVSDANHAAGKLTVTWSSDERTK